MRRFLSDSSGRYTGATSHWPLGHWEVLNPVLLPVGWGGPAGKLGGTAALHDTNSPLSLFSQPSPVHLYLCFSQNYPQLSATKASLSSCAPQHRSLWHLETCTSGTQWSGQLPRFIFSTISFCPVCVLQASYIVVTLSRAPYLSDYLCFEFLASPSPLKFNGKCFLSTFFLSSLVTSPATLLFSVHFIKKGWWSCVPRSLTEILNKPRLTLRLHHVLWGAFAFPFSSWS